MKKHATEKTLNEFCKAVYPKDTELCMTVNGEDDILKEATRIINDGKSALAAKDAELSVNKRMVDLLASRVEAGSVRHIGCMGCGYLTSAGWCSDLHKSVCIERIMAWALEEASNEQDNK